MSTMELCYDAAVVASTREYRLRSAGRQRNRLHLGVSPRWRGHGWLACARERERERRTWLPQVPSPAQAANLGWYVLWFIGVPPVDQLALCICGLLRLGVKRLQQVGYGSFINAGRTSPARRRNRQDVSCRRKAVAANYFGYDWANTIATTSAAH
ncbi:MAG: hypothetical protein R3C56_31365 [Pirellulaceae bacterium]